MKPPVILRIFKDNTLIAVKQFTQEQITFGNGGEVDVTLDHSTVSPIHCIVELRETGYFLADLGSVHGTFKNERQILDEVISSGDQITIGQFTIAFFIGVPKPAVTPPPIPEPTIQVVKPLAETTTKAPIANKPSEVAKIPDVTKLKDVPKPKEVNSAKSVEKPRSPVSQLQNKNRRDNKNFSTFAPATAIADLQKHLQLTKGPMLEVVIVWGDRILNVLHFTQKKNLTIGTSVDCDIYLPQGLLPPRSPFLEWDQGTRIFLAPGWEASIRQATGVQKTAELKSMGRLTSVGTTPALKLEQVEVARLILNTGSLEIYVRHVPTTSVPALLGSEFSASEITGLILSLVVVGLFAIYMSVYSPNPEADKNEDQLRLAQFVYTKPPEPVKPPPPPPPPPKEKEKENPPPPPPPPVKEPLQKVDLTKQATDSKSAATPQPKAQQKAAKAMDVRPMNNNKPKIFTSTRQGGATKLSDSDSSNAQSARDVTKTGLLSAFSGGGTREKLDQAYSGQGEMLGLAGKATGTSGQNSDRTGSDLGSQFKDAGAGGRGTQTQGISGLGTVGRSSGQSSYGQVGVGGKGRVNIEVGGSGAAFTGTVDREAVRRVVRSIYNQIKNCYERGLRANSDLEGKIIVHWEVAEHGRVMSSKVKDASSELQNIAECVALRIREQRFPEPPANSMYEVDFPFMMGKQ